MERKTWGYCLSLDLFDCDREKITRKKPIKIFIRELLEIINMKPYGDSMICRFGEGDLYGVSAIQLLMTSNLAIHCNEQNGCSDLYLDLFSCRQFEIIKVIEFAQKFFDAKEIKFDYKER